MSSSVATTPDPVELSHRDLDLIRSDLVRTALACFTTDDGEAITAAPHHLLMAFVLQRSWLGNTAIAAPPGHAKTYWAGAFFPAWYLGTKWTDHILYVSATAAHANRQSVNVRDTLVGNRNYQRLFPWIKPDRKKGFGEIEWFLERTSQNDPFPSFLATGREGKILGMRADVLLLDDVNDEEEQRTPDQRIKTLDWMSHTAMSRLKPGGRAIAIQTRWHVGDVIGFALEHHWTYLHFRALAEDAEQVASLTIWDDDHVIGAGRERKTTSGLQVKGRVEQDLRAEGWSFTVEELGQKSLGTRKWVFRILLHRNGPALWPEWIPAEQLRRTRLQYGEGPFANMYQNEPVPDGGAIFPVQDLRRYKWDALRSQVPHLTRIIQSWDTAFSESSHADYSVCTTWGQTLSRDFYLLDVFRKRITYPDLKRQVAEQADRFNPSAVLIEDAASGRSLVQELQRLGHVPIIPRKPDRDKVTRASTVTGWIAAGKVYVPDNAAWSSEYLSELGFFPKGDHDDQVDSTTQALRYLIDTSGSGFLSLDDYGETGERIVGNIWERQF